MAIIYNGNKDVRQFKSAISETIKNLLTSDEKVVYLDCDLSSCIGCNKLINEFDRAINCGIAEANMAGIAGGLSSGGMKPIIHTFGPFASRRCYDQIFLSGGYAKNSITVIGTDPGVTAAFNGGTHMPFEDTGLYRLIPYAYICDVTDIPMLNCLLKKSVNMKGIKYFRVPRKDSYLVYSDDTDFDFGKGKVIFDAGTDCLIIASGIMVNEAMKAAGELSKSNIKVTVIDPVTIKPLDEKLILDYANKCKKIVVAENHNKIGGLVSAVKELLCGQDVKVSHVAVEDIFGEVGPQDYLQKQFKLTAEHIIEVVKNLN